MTLFSLKDKQSCCSCNTDLCQNWLAEGLSAGRKPPVDAPGISAAGAGQGSHSPIFVSPSPDGSEDPITHPAGTI